MNRLFRGLLAGGLFSAAAGTLLMMKRRREEQMRLQNRFGYMRMRRMMNNFLGKAGEFSRVLLGTWLLRRNWLR